MAITTKKILYIEDDPEARFLMADIIRFKGYIYLEAERGLEGIKLAKKHLPNLILVDLHLPDMQGFEVTTHLKNHPGLKNTPIIALTAATQKDVKELVLTAGCDGYITKPINITEFLHKLEEYLAGKKEFVQANEEKFYLKKYNIQLVSRLKKKITELETLNANLTNLNNDLFNSREELAHYNDRLFYLNNLANYLRTLHDPVNMIQVLPAKIIEGFLVERCVIFECEANSSQLKPSSAAGFSNSQLNEIRLHFSESFLAYLKNEGGILWIKDTAEILEKHLLEIAAQLSTSSFIIANLDNLGTQSERTGIYDRMTLDRETTGDVTEFNKCYIIFIDKNKTRSSFATYEIRILKSFLQTVGIIYENMTLYSRVIQLYKIKADEAIHDGMTQVYNYRYFIQELEREANRTRRYNTPFSLLMIDIDHFKEYNDLHGHLQGDRVLCTISKLIDQNTRTTDTAARYGGEEFAVILPGLQKKDAVYIAQKIQHLIANYHFPDTMHRPTCRITISIGVACFPDDSNETAVLLSLADHALYKAKDLGRNMVCAADSACESDSISSSPAPQRPST